jgi:amylovoran biosynthesis glycosyltransferase AmsD
MNKLNSWLAVHSFLFQGNYKLIAAEHINFNSATFLRKTLKILLYRRFSAIVVLTSSNKEKYIKYGLKKVYVIPNIASFMPSDIADYKEREQIILIVGRLGRQKNISDMITIWGNIYSKYSEWKLLIIGEGSESKKLKKLILSKGIPDTQCQLINSQKDICKYYNNAQIVTLTSLFEGLPMVLIEAMTYGCPCISYDCETGPSDIIVNNQTGFLIPCSDLEKFQEKLEILLNNEELRMQFFQRSLIERYRFSSSEILHKWFPLFSN